MKTAAALALLGVLLVGCSAPSSVSSDDDAVDVELEPDAVRPQGIGIGGCPSIPSLAVDATTQVYGKSNPSDPCDWFVTELTTPADHNWAFKVRGKSPAEQGIVINSATECANSSMTSQAYGKRAPYYTFENGHLVHKPGGNWVRLAAPTVETGTWSGTSCTFPNFYLDHGLGNEDHAGAIPVDAGVYTHVRVGTKSTLRSTTGNVAGSIVAYKEWW